MVKRYSPGDRKPRRDAIGHSITRDPNGLQSVSVWLTAVAIGSLTSHYQISLEPSTPRARSWKTKDVALHVVSGASDSFVDQQLARAGQIWAQPSAMVKIWIASRLENRMLPLFRNDQIINLLEDIYVDQDDAAAAGIDSFLYDAVTDFIERDNEVSGQKTNIWFVPGAVVEPGGNFISGYTSFAWTLTYLPKGIYISQAQARLRTTGHELGHWWSGISTHDDDCTHLMSSLEKCGIDDPEASRLPPGRNYIPIDLSFWSRLGAN